MACGCRFVTQFSSTARDAQPVTLTVTWNNKFVIEGAANVIGQYPVKFIIRAALVSGETAEHLTACFVIEMFVCVTFIDVLDSLSRVYYSATAEIM